MLTGRLVTEEDTPKAPRTKVSSRTESSQALVGLLSLARKAESAASRSVADLDKPADPLAGVVSRPVLRSLLAAMQYRNPAIVTHGRRTARLAVALATQLGWERPQLTHLELAALLHDLGKVGVPDNILAKPGRLSGDEAGLVAAYYGIALDVLAAGRVHPEVLAIVAQAYPSVDPEPGGRGAGETHVGARLLAVADAYDSLRTDQPYRPAVPHAEALATLSASKDFRFDGNVVAALMRLAESTGPSGGPLAPHPADAELPALSAADAQEAAALCQIFSHMYILESLYDGFTLVDADLRYVLASRGATRLLGRSTADLHGKSWASRTLPATDQDGRPLLEYELPLNKVLADDKPVSRPLRIEAVGGRWVDVELQAVPLTNEAGRLLGIAEIFRNQSRTGAEPPQVRELKLAAARDPLTGLSNRGDLEAQLAKAMEKFASSGTPLSVLFLDVDFFKRINDNYGHAVGDEVLVGLAKLLRQECYSGEALGRYGGEEFVVVCPETDIHAARRRAERLRLAVSQSILCDDPDIKVTASFGVAAAEKGDTTDSLVRRADKALYEAKRSGRNRTCSFTAEEVSAPKSVPVVDTVTDDPFFFAATFRAYLAADMAVFKLGGFLRDENAVLVDVAPGRATLRMGRPALFGGWGSRGKNRPVEVRLEFGDPSATPERGRPIDVRVAVRPLARVRSADVFKARAREVFNLLRSYFAGTDA